MYLGHVHGLILALAPTSQALWDTAFNKAVVSCQTKSKDSRPGSGNK